MKRKLLIALIAITAALCGAFGFAACGDDSGNGGNGGDTNQGGNTQKPDDGKNEHTTHTYNKKVTEAKYLKSEATCQKKAEYYFSCECGEKGTQTFEYGELADHKFENYVSNNNATCVKNGTETAKCEHCTETDTREKENSKLDHVFKNYVSDNNATCVKNGTETAKCENCTETDTREKENSKLDHIFENYISDNNATCVNNGTETAKCENCTETDTREKENSKLNHKLTNSISATEATCTQNGNIAYFICESCEKWFKDKKCEDEITDKETVKIAKLGHNFTFHDINEATCTKNGNSVAYFDCERCKKWFTDENGQFEIIDKSSIVINRNGHQYENELCTICGNHKPTDGLEYEEYSDYALVIGLGNVKDTEIYIADYYRDKSVTAINENAFRDCSSLISITIPDSVTSIGDKAFYGCSSLTSVTIPDGVTSIGYRAFYNCSSLTSITIPDSVTSIGISVFYKCASLTNITFEGTKAQWKAIEKGYSWNNNTGNYTVHCTDGDI